MSSPRLIAYFVCPLFVRHYLKLFPLNKNERPADKLKKARRANRRTKRGLAIIEKDRSGTAVSVAFIDFLLIPAACLSSIKLPPQILHPTFSSPLFSSLSFRLVWELNFSCSRKNERKNVHSSEFSGSQPSTLLSVYNYVGGHTGMDGIKWREKREQT